MSQRISAPRQFILPHSSVSAVLFHFFATVWSPADFLHLSNHRLDCGFCIHLENSYRAVGSWLQWLLVACHTWRVCDLSQFWHWNLRGFGFSFKLGEVFISLGKNYPEMMISIFDCLESWVECLFWPWWITILVSIFMPSLHYFVDILIYNLTNYSLFYSWKLCRNLCQKQRNFKLISPLLMQ